MTGKVRTPVYYDALEARTKVGSNDTALIRIE